MNHLIKHWRDIANGDTDLTDQQKRIFLLCALELEAQRPHIQREYAIKARRLMDGMRKRVNRDPDIADYVAGFEEVDNSPK